MYARLSAEGAGSAVAAGRRGRIGDVDNQEATSVHPANAGRPR